MKVKNDFVTNSSSCSYIVCIPDMDLFIQDIETYTKIPKEIEGKLLKNRAKEEFTFFDDECTEEEYEQFGEIHSAALKLGYIIGTIEYGPDNIPMYYNIASTQKDQENLKRLLNDNRLGLLFRKWEKAENESKNRLRDK